MKIKNILFCIYTPITIYFGRHIFGSRYSLHEIQYCRHNRSERTFFFLFSLKKTTIFGSTIFESTPQYICHLVKKTN